MPNGEPESVWREIGAIKSRANDMDRAITRTATAQEICHNEVLPQIRDEIARLREETHEDIQGLHKRMDRESVERKRDLDTLKKDVAKTVVNTLRAEGMAAGAVQWYHDPKYVLPGGAGLAGAVGTLVWLILTYMGG